jgi:hypothetical protein
MFVFFANGSSTITILEREMRTNPMAGSASITAHTMDDDLHMKLLYLENRGILFCT